MTVDLQKKIVLRFGILIVGLLYMSFTILYSSNQLVIEDISNNCNLQLGSCSVLSEEFGVVKIEFTPRPIQTIKEFSIKVKIDKPISQLSVFADFQGADMAMGYNRPELLRVGLSPYEGKGFLPICSEEMLEWKMVLLLKKETRVTAIPFYFNIPGVKTIN